ncbi:MAG: DUF805 domain-containing protein [Ruminococcaceae bacterium]|nr:DUF805 domain-containing protein [Oscillospiraceae bacterium]
MIKAFKEMISRWNDFTGITDRPTFWWATLATFIVHLILSILGLVPFIAYMSGSDPTAGPAIALFILLLILYSIVTIFLAIAHLAMEIRRIRDAGLPWWFWFIQFLVSIGQVAVIVFWCLPTSKEPIINIGSNNAKKPPSQAEPKSAQEPVAETIEVSPEEAPVVEDVEEVEEVKEVVLEETPVVEEAPVVEKAMADDGTWKCECGANNDGNFCVECGAKKPE